MRIDKVTRVEKISGRGLKENEKEGKVLSVVHQREYRKAEPRDPPMMEFLC